MVRLCTQMHHRSRKYQITIAVRNQLPSDDTPVETIINTWWLTKSSESLRLSAHGDQAFRHAEIEFFDVPISITHEKWNSFIVDCGKKLKCPFFIGMKRDKGPNGPFIRLYDSKIAMMLTLYGDIHGYLESIKIKK